MNQDKYLYILRGVPGSGKSTWVKNNGYSDYVVSSDEIRIHLSGILTDPDGKRYIDQSKNNQVFDRFFKEIESMMIRGLMVVADATHTNERDFAKYLPLCDKYGYKAVCIDFSKTPIKTALERNKKREDYRVVPEHVIFKMANNLKNSKVPDWVEVIDA